MMAIVIKGDALNPEQIQKAFDQIEEVDAVVSTIGGTPADPTADSQVPRNEAAVLHKFKRVHFCTDCDKLHKLDMLVQACSSWCILIPCHPHEHLMLS